jgi:hypothetical protein
MKASTEMTILQLSGEEGGRLVVTFTVEQEDAAARILFVDEWRKGREVTLDLGELERLREVLSTDAQTMRKHGASLKLESDGLVFTVRDTNRGEPYRDGFDFNIEREWEGYPIFVELDECRTFARAIGKILKDGPTPSPSR